MNIPPKKKAPAEKKDVIKRRSKMISNFDRIKLSMNPTPGRSVATREYINRRLDDIAYEISWHLGETDGAYLRWLPEAVITPTNEGMYSDAYEVYAAANTGSDGYITNGEEPRASNRVRVISWYENPETHQQYLAGFIIVSPLPDELWGGLPLTHHQWGRIINPMMLSHLRWKWIFAVRKWWGSDSYEVGGTMGWHMEPCVKLDKSNSGDLWIGQAIYSPVVREYSVHVLEK